MASYSAHGGYQQPDDDEVDGPRYNSGFSPQTEQEILHDAYLDSSRLETVSQWHRVDKDDVISILKHHQQISRNLALLGADTQEDREGSATKREALAACERSLEMMKSFLTHTLGFDPLKTLPSESSGRVAEEVFGIPKVAEMIFLELSPARLLHIMPTCKSFGDVITEPRGQLATRLGRRPAPDSYWTTPFTRQKSYDEHWKDSRARDSLADLHEYLECHFVDNQQSMANPTRTSMVTMYAKFLNHSVTRVQRPLPRVGERSQAMLICQPPITEMSVILSCRRRPRGANTGAKIRNPDGLTVGDLLHATEEHAVQHEQSSHAESCRHDRTGLVRSTVSFRGDLLLREDDPSLLELR
ncbi:hypothetical protein LTR91_010551 [Friedmanniomyces endolithicus]|uniref:F-box domain-containing protein n=1 Tax=Friedmanniomyces endolithicus TaxID=329885 RepID=A0AAN6IZY4_9PEZI|nr:hypothetical protein LTR01_008649 [Friedmanniomyces endolithicus]KAK0305077.1 hypothetical protein LTR82_016932 [Friedmanniomyces endolithicus]KAK0823578.1 hypothetical protein LTR73_008384 [Friedmanniomyces endolithicus]KAK0906861.1 hypothetical protein LTR57_017584 [Friedmanniomyces endolithicus]KAK0963256.1 hypothetical protein LTS01_019411 [Friedmanniomyces endolithicus]